MYQFGQQFFFHNYTITTNSITFRLSLTRLARVARRSWINIIEMEEEKRKLE